MQLSIVILCWNDLKVIGDCLRTIYAGTHTTNFEVIVSDNGSTDGSVEFIRSNFPQVRVLENGRNLRFSKGNNVGIRECTGDLILILNPDTLIHDGALDRFVEFADQHPEAGAFGCRALWPDGSYQGGAWRFPTIWRLWMQALYLWPLGYFSDVFAADKYLGWRGDTEREIDWMAGFCLLVRAKLLKSLGGFDERFYYYCEDLDLCHRIRKAGYKILYTPNAVITHLMGMSSAKRFPVPFELDKYRNRYRYYYKYYGRVGVRRYRRVALASLHVRQVGYGLLRMVRPTEELKKQLELYGISAAWHKYVNPVRLVENGEEPVPAVSRVQTLLQSIAPDSSSARKSAKITQKQ